MTYRLFKGPLNSIKNLKAYVHSVFSILEETTTSRNSENIKEALYVPSIQTVNTDYSALTPNAECPEEDPCVGCTPTPTPTFTPTPTPTPTFTPTITPTITKTHTPTVTHTPTRTPSITPSSSYSFFGPFSSIIP